MPIPAISYLLKFGHLIWLNQNRVFDGEVDKKTNKETLQHSCAMEDIPVGRQDGYWSIANIDFSRDARNFTDISTIFTAIGAYFESMEGTVAHYVGTSFNAVADWFFGARDDSQYRVIGRGAGFPLSDEDRLNQEKTINKTFFGDDLHENEFQRVRYGEKLTAYLGRLANASAKLKPYGYFLGGIFGGGASTAVRTLLDIPASLWWRCRMFGPSLHANFATTMLWDLPSLWIKSFVSDTAKDQLAKKKGELNSLASSYFENLGINISKPKTDSKLSTYFAMLKHRMKEHWRGIVNPEKVYKEKRDKELITNKNDIGRDRNESILMQRLASITDFTGPINAAFGIFTLCVFGPIRAVMSALKVERGMSLIHALFSLRKLTHLGNYVTRFVIPEIVATRDFKKYERIANAQGEKSNDLAKEFYYASKARYYNALVNGSGMVLLNLAEPFLHSFDIGNSEGSKPFMNAFMRINEAIILKFFSSRRTQWGRMSFIETLVRQKHEHFNLENMQKMNMSKEQIEKEAAKIRNKMLDRDAEENERRIVPLDQGLKWISEKINKFRNLFEEVGVLDKVA